MTVATVKKGDRWSEALARRNGLSFAGSEATATVRRNRAIDDGSAVNALPGVENEEEIGEPLEHHEPFTLWTFHRPLPGLEVKCCSGSKQELNHFVKLQEINHFCILVEADSLAIRGSRQYKIVHDVIILSWGEVPDGATTQ
jgi:hypothetical protein